MHFVLSSQHLSLPGCRGVPRGVGVALDVGGVLASGWGEVVTSAK